MKVIWEVDDGYLGKSRPHETFIPDDELKDVDDEARIDIINEYVDHDFSSIVTFSIIRVEEE
jgi:hypothetical protein